MSTFEVRRSALIPAPAGEIFPLVNSFHEWPAWSPWEAVDPGMSRRYFGSESGTGAGYEFTKPFKALNPTTFMFAPAPGGTEVTWLMTGENKGLGKVFALFMNMDKLVGGDFERGLAALSTAVAARKG